VDFAFARSILIIEASDSKIKAQKPPLRHAITFRVWRAKSAPPSNG
jgi:hypothetical protein